MIVTCIYLQAIADELLQLIKSRQLMGSSGFLRGGVDRSALSPSKLLLCLIALKATRNEVKILTALVDLVQESYAEVPAQASSVWFQRTIWARVTTVTPWSLMAAIEDVVKNCAELHLESMATPLVSLAFELLGSSRSTASLSSSAGGAIDGAIGTSVTGGGGYVHGVGHIKRSVRTVLTSKVLAVPALPGSQYTTSGPSSDGASPRRRAAPSSPAALGAWMIWALFETQDYARRQIAK
jgi:hypothetical protein